MREYTTRNGDTFYGREGTERTIEALTRLEQEEINRADGHAWLIEHRYTAHEQPSTYDDQLIRLDTGHDVMWNDERGQWEPAIWFYI